jgi:beta-glucosidase
LPVYYYQKPSAKRAYRFTKNQPSYPFGHALSYTMFQYDAVNVSPAEIAPNGTAVATIDVSGFT